MKCILCSKKAIINLQQGWLCKTCFLDYFEKKVYRTIRKFKLIDKKDKLCVACSGGKDSLTTLYLVNKLATQQKQSLFALAINEGIKGYRDITLNSLKLFCKQHKIDLKIVSFKSEFGHTLDELIKLVKSKDIDITTCSLCGILRRRLINQCARKFGANKVVTGHNLDDEAQTILMNFFKGGVELAARLGPTSGILKHAKFIARVKPLYFCSEKETKLYVKLKKFKVNFRPCPHRKISYRAFVDNLLNKFESKYKGTKTSIIKNFLIILPLLKEKFAVNKNIKECKYCGELSKQEICAVCKILEQLRIN